jgi:hypothetical protein
MQEKTMRRRLKHSERLYLWREKLGLTPQEAAAILGMKEDWYKKFESGKLEDDSQWPVLHEQCASIKQQATPL